MNCFVYICYRLTLYMINVAKMLCQRSVKTPDQMLFLMWIRKIYIIHQSEMPIYNLQFVKIMMHWDKSLFSVRPGQEATYQLCTSVNSNCQIVPAARLTRWLSCYLRGRQAATSFRGTKSSTRIVRTGVPQGSQVVTFPIQLLNS